MCMWESFLPIAPSLCVSKEAPPINILCAEINLNLGLVSSVCIFSFSFRFKGLVGGVPPDDCPIIAGQLWGGLRLDLGFWTAVSSIEFLFSIVI